MRFRICCGGVEVVVLQFDVLVGILVVVFVDLGVGLVGYYFIFDLFKVFQWIVGYWVVQCEVVVVYGDVVNGIVEFSVVFGIVEVVFCDQC